MIEEITTRDEQGQIATSGSKILPSGAQAPDGPPTTLSKKGKDRVAFFQANITRDATHNENGTPIGARDMFTVGAHFFSDGKTRHDHVHILLLMWSDPF